MSESDSPLSDEDEENYEFDGTVFANPNRDRMERSVEEWCSCGHCSRMATEDECVCCGESHIIRSSRGEDKTCIVDVRLFKELVLNKEGLQFGRYMYSLQIEDEKKRKRYQEAVLTNKNLRFLAYKQFINMLSADQLDRRIRYILPACVVSAVRDSFPNEDGVPYSGFVAMKTSDGHILP